MTDIRELLESNQPYWEFCREERNVAALLYHLLLCRNNLELFCEVVDYRVELSDPAVYFEYAYLRDLWNGLGVPTKPVGKVATVNEQKRMAILELLKPSASHLASCGVQEFNRHFGAGHVPSTKHIQSPGTWTLKGFRQTITDPDEFRRTCMFKWAFNAKPDIVIQADPDHALCIEAKLQSGEGQYPVSKAEKAMFKEFDLEPVSQTQLQQYLMRELLGIETEFVLLAEKTTGQKTTNKVISWQQAFGGLDYEGQPSMVCAWGKKMLGVG